VSEKAKGRRTGRVSLSVGLKRKAGREGLDERRCSDHDREVLREEEQEEKSARGERRDERKEEAKLTSHQFTERREIKEVSAV